MKKTRLKKYVISSLVLMCCTEFANANELKEPSVLTSTNKVLDLLMIAKPVVLSQFQGVTGWVYQICERKFSKWDSCLAGKANDNPYGGTRLQLNAGDTLRIHLVNKLPMVNEAKHSDEPGEQFLAQNPTNLHTHGMLVSPAKPAPSDKHPKYGDNVFVLTFNSANGAPDLSALSHMHGDVRNDSTDYEIKIPPHHPSGLYWFHPHAHGVSLNQVSAGLSGILTVGQVNDYIPSLSTKVKIRHLILKDLQVSNGVILNDQEDPALCDLASSKPGECHSTDGDTWYFTINGQQNPQITVQPDGEIWRLTNSSGSATYDLQLIEKSNALNPLASGMAMQLISIDGISVNPSSSNSMKDLKQMAGNKVNPVACPGVDATTPSAICINKLHMMPGTRAEIWVANRNASGVISNNSNQAIFRTTGYVTGSTGDSWPAVDLAHVNFNKAENAITPPSLNVASAVNYQTISKELAKANSSWQSTASNCQPLPAGWRRRIFFGYPTPVNFGLGLELVDDKNHAVRGSFQDIAAFPNAPQSICIPLADGNKPVSERWEIINLTGEDHNFHIHQTKFRVLTDGEVTAGVSKYNNTQILQDSVPALTGSDSCDGTIATWRSGACQTKSVTVEIPFAIAGDFVYHCHILEHEDGGMMATVHVVSSTKP